MRTTGSLFTFGLLLLIIGGASFIAAPMSGWAQSGGLSKPAAGGYAAFETLLAKHGNRNMTCVVRAYADPDRSLGSEVIGKCMQSTDAFLIIQLQNQQDLTFIPWQNVVYVTAKPS